MSESAPYRPPRRTVDQGHPCADCNHRAVVGWGQPPVWLCLDHYEQRMEAIGATLRELRARFDADIVTDG